MGPYIFVSVKVLRLRPGKFTDSQRKEVDRLLSSKPLAVSFGGDNIKGSNLFGNA